MLPELLVCSTFNESIVQQGFIFLKGPFAHKLFFPPVLPCHYCLKGKLPLDSSFQNFLLLSKGTKMPFLILARFGRDGVAHVHFPVVTNAPAYLLSFKRGVSQSES